MDLPSLKSQTCGYQPPRSQISHKAFVLVLKILDMLECPGDQLLQVPNRAEEMLLHAYGASGLYAGVSDLRVLASQRTYFI
jgi:hypothetical protein